MMIVREYGDMEGYSVLMGVYVGVSFIHVSPSPCWEKESRSSFSMQPSPRSCMHAALLQGAREACLLS